MARVRFRVKVATGVMAMVVTGVVVIVEGERWHHHGCLRLDVGESDDFGTDDRIGGPCFKDATRRNKIVNSKTFIILV